MPKGLHFQEFAASARHVQSGGIVTPRNNKQVKRGLLAPHVQTLQVAYRLLGDRTEAEDVAQEACARTYSRWASVRDHAEPWCVRVASNLAT